MPQKLNAKGRPFSWAFSSLNDYEGCPLRYAHGRYYCTTQFQETVHTKWGNRVHKAAELRLKRVNPNDDEALDVVWPYVEAILRAGTLDKAERELALDRSLQPVNWYGKDVWFRAKIDVQIVRRAEKAMTVIDWKTGKLKEDQDQLKLTMAACALVHPEINTFEGRYVWLKYKPAKITSVPLMAREAALALWPTFVKRAERMEEAWETETFPARRSPLCGWCQVDTKYCPHAGGRRA